MRNKRYTVVLGIIAVIESVLLIAFPFFTSKLVDSAIDASNGAPMHKLYLSMGMLLGVILGLVLLRIFDNALYSAFYLKLEKRMKKELFSSLIKKEYKGLSDYHQAEIDQLFTADISYILKRDLDTIPSLIRQVLRLVLAIVYLMFIDWRFLVVVLILGVFGMGCAKIYSRLMRPRHKRVLEEDGRMSSFTIEAFEQIKLISSYEAWEYAKGHYDVLNKNSFNARRSRNRILYTANSGFYAFSNLVYLGALCYGAYAIGVDMITYGSMIALVQLLSNIQNPLLSFSSLLNQLNLASASRGRINNAMSLDDIGDMANINDFNQIKFDHVSFSYNNEVNVIDDLSFEINKGDIVLLQGPSGVGKTTLFMLMLGFIVPSAGSISVDGIDISKAKSLFSYVPQENILFSGSIRDNIYILTGKSGDEVINALRLANIYDEIEAMPDKLDTMLKSRGAGLSLGQIQRVLIAIAILRDSNILLLDEFSSALDKDNEEIIINNLKGIGKTILYITHRDSHIDGSRVVRLNKE